MFKAIDENGDGSVSFDEWLSFAYKNYQVSDVNDSDGNGNCDGKTTVVSFFRDDRWWYHYHYEQSNDRSWQL